MQESSTKLASYLGLIYWGHKESKGVITRDGRMVGLIRGILVDSTKWTVPLLVAEAEKEILKELNIENPLQASLVSIPTTFVENISDVVQLKTDLASMKGAVSMFSPWDYPFIGGSLKP